MRSMLLLPLTLLIIAASSGCVSRTAVTTDGRKCRALSDEQIEYLTVMTRNAVIKNAAKHKLSAAEVNFIRKTEPDIKVRYRGDCFGTMFIQWETHAHVIGMRFENRLDVRLPQCALIVRSTDGKKFQPPQQDKKQPGQRPGRKNREYIPIPRKNK